MSLSVSMKPSSLHVFGESVAWQRSTRAGVSLHCHTLHSKELLDFIPHYAARLPLIAPLFRNEMNRYLSVNGRTIDFNRCYWTPPCTARQVYETERLQIEARLVLPALVSLTDHDDITAGVQLQTLSQPHAPTRPPISLEWTVPYGAGFFHLGIHNLPPDEAQDITRELLAYTDRGAAHIELAALLDWLNEFPEVLIVFNHPIWDIEHIGQSAHDALLREFLREHVHQLHAFEINGFRSWKENQAVIALAETHHLPVVTGGDRHGEQTNTLINLTRAENFADFVGEVRDDGHSTTLLFPEYSQSRTARTFAIVADVLRTYSNHPVGERWTERIFIDLTGRGARPLSDYWQRNGPAWVRAALWCIKVLGSPHAQPALRLALSKERIRYES
jgi:hypothetical protein